MHRETGFNFVFFRQMSLDVRKSRKFRLAMATLVAPVVHLGRVVVLRKVHRHHVDVQLDGGHGLNQAAKIEI